MEDGVDDGRRMEEDSTVAEHVVRSVSAVRTTKIRKIGDSRSSTRGIGVAVDQSRAEIDNHADTCVVGDDALIFHHFDRVVHVSGFHDDLGTVQDKAIVSAALAYDDPLTGEVIILAVHQAIHLENMDHHLLCPMQMRMHDIQVNECPKFLDANPTDDSHSIIIPDDGEGEPYKIPLSLHGVTSYFPTRRPTQEEFETCRRFDLTYETPVFMS